MMLLVENFSSYNLNTTESLENKAQLDFQKYVLNVWCGWYRKFYVCNNTFFIVCNFDLVVYSFR